MKTLARITVAMACLLTGSAAVAQTEGSPVAQAVCDTVATTALKTILESQGFPVDASEAAYEAWAEYLKNPDDTKLDATARSLTTSALSAMFPGAGIAFTGSKLVVTGVEATISEAERQKVEAFICATRSFGQLPTVDFFKLPAVQIHAPGVNCQNFAEWVTTYDKVSTLKNLWEGHYSREVKRVRVDDEETRQMLTAGWAILQARWANRWAEIEFGKIREAVRREAAAAPQQCAQPKLQPASYGDPRTAKGHYVDRCYAYASGCDDNTKEDPAAKPSANAFCKSKGHSGVAPNGSQWSYKAPTEIQSSGQLCEDAKGCGGLDWVSCQ